MNVLLHDIMLKLYFDIIEAGEENYLKEAEYRT